MSLQGDSGLHFKVAAVFVPSGTTWQVELHTFADFPAIMRPFFGGSLSQRVQLPNI